MIQISFEEALDVFDTSKLPERIIFYFTGGTENVGGTAAGPNFEGLDDQNTLITAEENTRNPSTNVWTLWSAGANPSSNVSVAQSCRWAVPRWLRMLRARIIFGVLGVNLDSGHVNVQVQVQKFIPGTSLLQTIYNETRPQGINNIVFTGGLVQGQVILQATINHLLLENDRLVITVTITGVVDTGVGNVQVALTCQSAPVGGSSITMWLSPSNVTNDITTSTDRFV